MATLRFESLSFHNDNCEKNLFDLFWKPRNMKDLSAQMDMQQNWMIHSSHRKEVKIKCSKETRPKEKHCNYNKQFQISTCGRCGGMLFYCEHTLAREIEDFNRLQQKRETRRKIGWNEKKDTNTNNRHILLKRLKPLASVCIVIIWTTKTIILWESVHTLPATKPTKIIICINRNSAKETSNNNNRHNFFFYLFLLLLVVKTKKKQFAAFNLNVQRRRNKEKNPHLSKITFACA